jgi:hypothetical protein
VKGLNYIQWHKDWKAFSINEGCLPSIHLAFDDRFAEYAWIHFHMSLTKNIECCKVIKLWKKHA